MFRWARSDTNTYLKGYPGKEDNPNAKKNFLFYSNELSSQPDGDLVENIHKDWFGNYQRLEYHHGFIQWLFPIREHGLNSRAQPLQLHEAKAIRETPEMQARIVKSYELMLDFYGMKLVDQETGFIARSSNYRERYHHLNRSFHNYLRITRILKCLGEVGLEHLKFPFVTHVMKEIYVYGQLTNVRRSLSDYWMAVLRNDDERSLCEKLFNQCDREKDVPAETILARFQALAHEKRTAAKKKDEKKDTKGYTASSDAPSSSSSLSSSSSSSSSSSPASSSVAAHTPSPAADDAASSSSKDEDTAMDVDEVDAKLDTQVADDAKAPRKDDL